MLEGTTIRSPIVSLDSLRGLVKRLRRDCPWDRQQDSQSMRPYLMEELYEVLGAIDAQDYEGLREELGDLLFQIFFHAELAEEAGHFNIEQVAEAIEAKMVARHPHVFENPELPGGPGHWERRKAEKRKGSRVDGVPSALPALQRAHRVGEKVAHVGFDWPDLDGVLSKMEEERSELMEAIASGDPARIRHEYGDLLLATSSLGRHLGISGEDALREANLRFEGRFRQVEKLAAAAGIPLESAGPEQLDAWWQEAKRG